jgi:Flavin-binding monooxygenase-like
MRVGIIGAGVAGLVTAKVLRQAGHEVVVYDKAPDVGGVWSRTRRYPGLTTQSPRAQYALSDFPMPRDYPEWPTGPQVQEYLAAYAGHFGLESALRLSTEVTAAVPAGGAGGWAVTAGGPAEHFDRLVVANGIFCEPAVPRYPGEAEFAAAGGRVLAGTELHDAEQARGARVVVVGYGKSACDVTVPLSAVAASTDVIARHLLWKVPRRIGGVLNFKLLLLTRMGEALFRYLRPRGVEKFLHGPGNGLRGRMINSIGTASVRQFGLKRLGLVPPGQMEDIVRGAIGLATEGFFEGVAAGRITVHADRVIARLLGDGGEPAVELDDGSRLRADLVVCATGFTQGVPFLPDDVTRRVRDERGNFRLYRQIRPVDVPGLYFNGYNSSFFSPLNAEIAALWIAADLAGAIPLPAPASMRQQVADQLAFMDEATDTHHCHGGKIIPFSLHNLDEVLGDLGVNVHAAVRAWHWLMPVDPAAYRRVTPAVLGRLPRAAATGSAAVVGTVSATPAGGADDGSALASGLGRCAGAAGRHAHSLRDPGGNRVRIRVQIGCGRLTHRAAAGGRPGSAGTVRDDYLDSLGGQHLLRDRAKLAEFFVAERVDQQFADGFHVAGGGFPDLVPARVGEHGVDPPAVSRARLPADPAPGLEAADDMAQPRQGTVGRRRQFAHPQRAAGCLGEPGEHEVVELGDARVLLQLGVQGRR